MELQPPVMVPVLATIGTRLIEYNKMTFDGEPMGNTWCWYL